MPGDLDFKLYSIKWNGEVWLRDLVKGSDKINVVVWMSTCPYCVKHLKKLNNGETDDLISISIDRELNEAVLGVADELQNIDHYHISDDDRVRFIKTWRITTVPFEKTLQDKEIIY